jgi:predicted membrane protein (TIGR00267 family)
MIFNKNKNVTLHILRARSIARRYFITNGFDGALTILGMLTGFYTSGMTELPVAISAILGATIALFISGLSSAYLSEKAERKNELRELEQALVTDLKESDYGKASRYLPILVALVNGFSPLLLSLLIILPLFIAEQGYVSHFSPFINSIAIALICVFLLGVYLGKVSKTFWLWSGLRTLTIAVITVALILFFTRSI